MAFPPSIFEETLVLTQSEIAAFHNIDRTLYSRLVIDLRRDPAVSMKVTALWIWLERIGCHPGKLIVRISNLVYRSLHALADEAVACLVCLGDAAFRPEYETLTLHHTKEITGCDLISLKGFHSNRDHIVDAIHKIMDEVCLKAFGDIYRRAIKIQACPNPNPNLNSIRNRNRYQIQNPRNMYKTPVSMEGGGYLDLLCSPLSNSRVDEEAHREFLNNELADVLEHIQLQDHRNGRDSDEEEDEELSPDERTIFLTFSKGYPISEKEVAQFFTRKYGDIYEAILLQEKPAGGQPLYARLVLRSSSTIPAVLGEKIKGKFSINGKHVWARKYVPRSGPKSSVIPTRLPPRIL